MTEGFDLQIITRGSYVDSETNPEKVCVIETATLRLSWDALNDYLKSIVYDGREVYADGEDGDREYAEYKRNKTQRRDEWERRVKTAIGLDEVNEGVVITQVHSEVFTAVHIWEVPKAQGSKPQDAA
jgi:hypothetical protein